MQMKTSLTFMIILTVFISMPSFAQILINENDFKQVQNQIKVDGPSDNRPEYTGLKKTSLLAICRRLKLLPGQMELLDYIKKGICSYISSTDKTASNILGEYIKSSNVLSNIQNIVRKSHLKILESLAQNDVLTVENLKLVHNLLSIKNENENNWEEKFRSERGRYAFFKNYIVTKADYKTYRYYKKKYNIDVDLSYFLEEAVEGKRNELIKNIYEIEHKDLGIKLKSENITSLIKYSLKFNNQEMYVYGIKEFLKNYKLSSLGNINALIEKDDELNYYQAYGEIVEIIISSIKNEDKFFFNELFNLGINPRQPISIISHMSKVEWLQTGVYEFWQFVFVRGNLDKVKDCNARIIKQEPNWTFPDIVKVKRIYKEGVLDNSLLHLAVLSNEIEVIKYALELYPELIKSTSFRDDLTALHQYVRAFHIARLLDFDIIKYLVDSGADVQAYPVDSYYSFMTILRSSAKNKEIRDFILTKIDKFEFKHNKEYDKLSYYQLFVDSIVYSSDYDFVQILRDKGLDLFSENLYNELYPLLFRENIIGNITDEKLKNDLVKFIDSDKFILTEKISRAVIESMNIDTLKLITDSKHDYLSNHEFMKAIAFVLNGHGTINDDYKKNGELYEEAKVFYKVLYKILKNNTVKDKENLYHMFTKEFSRSNAPEFLDFIITENLYVHLDYYVLKNFLESRDEGLTLSELSIEEVLKKHEDSINLFYVNKEKNANILHIDKKKYFHIIKNEIERHQDKDISTLVDFNLKSKTYGYPLTGLFMEPNIYSEKDFRNILDTFEKYGADIFLHWSGFSLVHGHRYSYGYNGRYFFSDLMYKTHGVQSQKNEIGRFGKKYFLNHDFIEYFLKKNIFAVNEASFFKMIRDPLHIVSMVSLKKFNLETLEYINNSLEEKSDVINEFKIKDKVNIYLGNLIYNIGGNSVTTKVGLSFGAKLLIRIITMDDSFMVEFKDENFPLIFATILEDFIFKLTTLVKEVKSHLGSTPLENIERTELELLLKRYEEALTTYRKYIGFIAARVKF